MRVGGREGGGMTTAAGVGRGDVKGEGREALSWWWCVVASTTTTKNQLKKKRSQNTKTTGKGLPFLEEGGLVRFFFYFAFVFVFSSPLLPLSLMLPSIIGFISLSHTVSKTVSRH